MINRDYYEEEVIRYKRKYCLFRCEACAFSIEKTLAKLGYKGLDSVKTLLSANSDELKEVILKIAMQLPDGRGNMSSVMYSSIVSELLYLADIDFEIHIGFVLPFKVEDTSKYDDYCFLVNYMYVKTDKVAYHNMNGVLNDDNFTYIHDDLVEV